MGFNPFTIVLSILFIDFPSGFLGRQISTEEYIECALGRRHKVQVGTTGRSHVSPHVPSGEHGRYIFLLGGYPGSGPRGFPGCGMSGPTPSRSSSTPPLLAHEVTYRVGRGPSPSSTVSGWEVTKAGGLLLSVPLPQWFAVMILSHGKGASSGARLWHCQAVPELSICLGRPFLTVKPPRLGRSCPCPCLQEHGSGCAPFVGQLGMRTSGPG